MSYILSSSSFVADMLFQAQLLVQPFWDQIAAQILKSAFF